MSKYYLLIITFISSIYTSCSSKKKVDAIYYNATIYTVDSVFSKQQAIAISADTIAFVGTTNEVLENYKSNLSVDLKGKFIYPGLNDAHCHFIGYAGDMYKCQLFGTHSFDEVLKNIVDYDKQSNLPFVYGRGWDQNNWDSKQFPNNKQLNILFANKPVLLKRIDGHAVLINDVLYKQAEATLKPFKNTHFIEVKNGKPTGILFDNAMDAVEKFLPKISRKLLIENILKAQKKCLSLGLTSLTDAGLDVNDILLVDSMQKSNLLKIRMNIMVSANDENLNYFEINHTFSKTKSNNSLRVASIKVYADGALGSRGACLKHPYSDDPLNYGKINISYSRIDTLMDWALKNKFQICTHAIGDSTNAALLKLYAKKLKQKNNLRWRIEHAQIVDSVDRNYFGDFNIIASVQPIHATSDMYWAAERLGNNRIKDAYAYNGLQKSGAKLALGTDFPVEYLNPLFTFYAATSRQDSKGFPENGFQKTDALNRQQALQGMTINAAYAAFLENKVGSLCVGKYADFIITDVDFMQDDLLKIRNSKITETYIAGKKVY